jgi:hypothetical protein
VRQAALISGVNRSRVGQRVEAERIPYETRPDGRRLFRRQQLEVNRQRSARPEVASVVNAVILARPSRPVEVLHERAQGVEDEWE